MREVDVKAVLGERTRRRREAERRRRARWLEALAGALQPRRPLALLASVRPRHSTVTLFARLRG